MPALAAAAIWLAFSIAFAALWTGCYPDTRIAEIEAAEDEQDAIDDVFWDIAQGADL